MQVVPIASRPLDGFVDVLGARHTSHLEQALGCLRANLGGRRVVHVNSTATGGGVAEMLSTLLEYVAAAGIDVAWVVIDGDAAFFDITKRIHNWLHDTSGDGGALGDEERARYDATLRTQSAELASFLRHDDVLLLHDPQTAGLIPWVRGNGLDVAWRCHVGVDEPGPWARRAWSFLHDDVRMADLCVFSRESYAWSGLDVDRTRVIPPCIDVLSAKNAPLAPMTTEAILAFAGLLEPPITTVPEYRRRDGTVDTVVHRAAVVEDEPVPKDAAMVVQISRWDRLKDHLGVLQAFARHGSADKHVHLVLAGPVDGVADDPESAETFEELRAARETAPADARRRCHLARLPMHDIEENAAIVNALQRRADVVVQKSLAEGFGLTVAEAMWKGRPVVASRVGGIRDQIVDRQSGLLVDPTDLAAFSRLVTGVLTDRRHAASIGRAAHQRVCDRFLPIQHFRAEAELVGDLNRARAARVRRAAS